MEINYLKRLGNYPSIDEKKSDYINSLKPLPELEIVNLEKIYNNGETFPKALKELLHLAGSACYLLEYGLSNTREEMQEDAREWLKRYDRSITRPFFVIDVFNGGDQFLFVYLDDGNDPVVYEAVLYDKTPLWVHSLLDRKLSEFLDGRLNIILAGDNPF